MPRVHPPIRMRNDETRGREHLTEEEVERLRRAAGKAGRHGHRDATMILLAYTHALRASELVALRWDQVDFAEGTVYVRRRKGSVSGTHPLRKVEVAAIKRLAANPRDRKGLVFRTERNTPISCRSFHILVARAGEEAGIAFPVHPHMLRHGCGYRLTNEGHDLRVVQAWMGHKNIQHTVRYTELAPDRFKRARFWED